MLLLYTLSTMLFVFILPDQEPKVYEVKATTEPFEITGKGKHLAWNQASLLTDFSLPWHEELAQPTSFRALWTESHFYFLYNVIDLEIITPGDPSDPRGVLPSDRIEIFFKVNQGMDPYYCLEMDPIGRVFDYEGHYYRNSNFDWKWPDDHIEIKASKTKDGYIVEGKISMESLKKLGILKDNLLDVGLFRGDQHSTSKNKTDVKWISWVHPNTDHPDFHVPSAFGQLILVE